MILFTACSSDDYKRGYAEGEKAGESKGYRDGYVSGQMAWIGGGWLPSLALGLAFGLGWIATCATVKLGKEPALKWLAEKKTQFENNRLARTLDARIERMREVESIKNKCQVETLTAAGLLRVCRISNQEKINTTVAGLLANSELLEELEAKLDVAVRSVEGAKFYIDSASKSLPAEVRSQLLEDFASQLDREPPSAQPAPPSFAAVRPTPASPFTLVSSPVYNQS